MRARMRRPRRRASWSLRQPSPEVDRRKQLARGAALVVGSTVAIVAVVIAVSRRKQIAAALGPFPGSDAGPGPSPRPSPSPRPAATETLPRNALEKLAADAAYAANVPPAIVFGIIRAESAWSNKPTSNSVRFNTTCITSKAGAVGLMQVLPSTAKSMGVTGDLCIPANAFLAGARFLRRLYAKYGDWKLVALAYNQGPANVDGYVATGIVSQGGNKLPDGRRTVTVRGMAYADKVLTEAARRGLAGSLPELDEPLWAVV